MTYEVLDIDRGDVLALHDSLETAKDELRHFVEEHPERGDDLAIATVGVDGCAVRPQAAQP